MVQQRSNEIEPNHPGRTPPGFSTRKEWGISTFSLQTILTTKGVTYFSAWSIFIFLQVRAQICALFTFVKWQKLWSSPLHHLGATAWPSLCCSSGKKRTNRDKQGGESFKNLGAEGFLQLKVFSYQPHFQLWTQSALATALCGSS